MKLIHLVPILVSLFLLFILYEQYNLNKKKKEYIKTNSLFFYNIIYKKYYNDIIMMKYSLIAFLALYGLIKLIDL